ncbi:DUF6498-containing protein [Hirschia litorea]|uniref:DUF6498-containing protein n=1 Tax=Hirschia litorea TaxID=1199156 RepID=A0ABW2IK10_9PROT
MFELAYWQRALQTPVILTGFLVDLLPLIAVLTMGWGALELVLLYWLENLVIGVITVIRILFAGVGKGNISSLFTALFMGSFFTIHYGGFCLGHGVFLLTFLGEVGGNSNIATSFSQLGDSAVSDIVTSMGLIGLVGILSAKFLWELYQHVVLYVRNGEHVKAEIGDEMFAPYGRIVLLHIGIFVGAFTMAKLGDPMIGILGLILLRAGVGVIANVSEGRKKQTIAG